ncbi:12224_t:CDS:2, partial [Dentiscutata heterogama]
MLPLQPKISEISSEFPIVKSFKKAAQEGAKVAGFAFSVSSSKMTCSKKDNLKSTKCQNCPVTLYAVLDKKAEAWVVQSSKNQHNHKLLLQSQVHCLYQHQILNPEQKETVYTMIKSGASVQSVADAIYWKHSTVYTKDIVNKRDRIKNALNKGSNHGSIRNLFFTHIESAYQTAICPEVLIVDATSQALRKAANIVFPEAKKIVHIWHMLAQNLRTMCRKFFNNEDDYNKLLLSIQKVAYAEEISIVKKAFDEKKDKECWINVFTKNYLHMGVYLTQRAEESHGYLKKAIEAASGLDQYDSMPMLSSSLLPDIAINKALYMLKEKYKNLNNCGSKATFLNKINTLIDKEIVTPKALLCIKNRG